MFKHIYVKVIEL